MCGFWNSGSLRKGLKKEYWKTSIEFNVSVQVSRWGTKGERGYRNLRGWMEVGLLVSQWSRGVG